MEMNNEPSGPMWPQVQRVTGTVNASAGVVHNNYNGSSANLFSIAAPRERRARGRPRRVTAKTQAPPNLPRSPCKLTETELFLSDENAWCCRCRGPLRLMAVTSFCHRCLHARCKTCIDSLWQAIGGPLSRAGDFSEAATADRRVLEDCLYCSPYGSAGESPPDRAEVRIRQYMTWKAFADYYPKEKSTESSLICTTRPQRETIYKPHPEGDLDPKLFE